jgi:hypothetical protein
MPTGVQLIATVALTLSTLPQLLETLTQYDVATMGETVMPAVVPEGTADVVSPAGPAYHW